MNTSIILPIENNRLPETPIVFGRSPDWNDIRRETDEETAKLLKEIMSIPGIELANISRQKGAEFSKAKIFCWKEVLEEIVKIFPSFKPGNPLVDDVVSWPLTFKKVYDRQDEHHFYFDANRLICEIHYLITTRENWGYDQLAWAGIYGRKFAEKISPVSIQELRRAKKERLLKKMELGEPTVRIIERILSETSINRFALSHYCVIISKKERLSRKDREKILTILDEELEK